MDQFDRSRFYREHDHVIRDHARRSRRGPQGPLGVMEHDRFGRPLLTFALIVVVATLLILVLAEIAGDRQTAAPAVEDAAVAGWTSGDASSTLVRPPGWIPSGRLPTVVIEYE